MYLEKYLATVGYTENYTGIDDDADDVDEGDDAGDNDARYSIVMVTPQPT